MASRPIKRRRLRAAVRSLQQTAPALPDRALAARLIAAWDNSAVADVDYLLTVIEHARDADGPILECGSGLTTITMAVYATQPVITLENDAGWHKRLSGEMAWLGLRGPRLVHAPLREFDGFAWYEPPTLPAMAALVVCDGPPRRGKPGGRVGLFPVLADQLADDVTVLVDTDMQIAERDALDVWEHQYGVRPAGRQGDTLILRRG